MSQIAEPTGNVKFDHILSELRRQIITNELPPGSQIPTRTEMEFSFGASRVTVQKAINQLIQDGFVDATRRKGSFVTQNPPHLSRYALVFPIKHSSSRSWRRFWTALSSEAHQLEDGEGHVIPNYYGVDGHIDSEGYRSLVEDVRSHRVAGLIFATNPYMLRDSPLLHEPLMARVAIMAPAAESKIPAVYPDGISFNQKALGYLRDQGCSRIAVIGPAAAQIARWQNDIADYGLQTHPYWIHGLSVDVPQAARSVAHLLMHGGQRQLPDGLIIEDDNLVEESVIGLIEAGVRVPHDLKIVTHCNYPYPSSCALPVKRLGYDSRQILKVCIESIDRQRHGEEVADFTPIHAVFEEELAEALKATGHSSP